ncbi:MAG TPA: tryptophan--tRNA ligase [Blastocatellia bacterium]|nr:tryptophan--tRNA ligase [Blastocatellia bacterium]
MTKKRIVSGMRPTGKLHLGNYEGALHNWVRLQQDYDCFYFVADLHALTSDYADTSAIKQNTVDMVIDWLAAGLDPNVSTIFVQSLVPQHAELNLLLSNVTPLGWLERVPTYKEQRENIHDKDIGNYAFLGYPVLMASDILMYKGEFVPVGKDQVAHLEITREITRRFNGFYGEVFPEPQPLLTEAPVLPGLDGRKMSKSYDNYLQLSEDPASVRSRIRTMVTDPARVRRTDPGNPEICPVYSFHKLYSSPETLQRVNEGCRTAGIGCIECKTWMTDNVLKVLEPIQARRREFEARPDDVRDIIIEGSRRAREEAERTMTEVRKAIKIDW